MRFTLAAAALLITAGAAQATPIAPTVSVQMAIVLCEKAFEHQLVRGRAAQTDVRVLVADDLVVRAIVHSGKARVAERRERIGGDRRGVALADDDDCGHAELFG